MPGAFTAHPLREAISLAHTVPGVTLRLHLESGNEMLVSYSCLGADLDPCRLRATMVFEQAHGMHRLAATVRSVELVAGLRPLGAGLYERSYADTDERWFVTALPAGEVAAALCDGPDQFRTVIKADTELGVHAICVSALPEHVELIEPGALDEAAVWALATVMTAELTAGLGAVPDPAERSVRPPSTQPSTAQPSTAQPSTAQPSTTQPSSHPSRPQHRKDHP